MGKKDSKAYGERNTGEGAVLMQIKPTKIIAEKDIAAWEWEYEAQRLGQFLYQQGFKLLLTKSIDSWNE